MKKRSDSGNILCLLGAHFSIAKGLHQALYDAKAYDCTAIQIFTKNATTWKERELISDQIDLFKRAKKETGISAIASHASYLINLASHEKEKYTKSCDALVNELIRSSSLDIPYVVLHPGAHMDEGEKKGTHRIIVSINEIFTKTSAVNTRLLLETTAGQGSSVGHTFEQLAAIMSGIEEKNRVGICLDTCHIFAAGYDIRTAEQYKKNIMLFDSVIGLEHLFLLHLNDSKTTLGSKVDRHEHIGHGSIGLEAFEFFMNDGRMLEIPKIIETPKAKDTEDWDRINLEQLKALVYTQRVS